MPCALELLPNEVLDQIISFLITEAPSRGQLHQVPSRQITQSERKDLKNLGKCSYRLLHLVRPRLFAHACFDLKDEWEFKDFVLASDLARYVQSLVVISDTIEIHPLKQPWWHRIFSFLDPTRVTILAPPIFIGNTLNTPIVDTDDEAFDIHFQALQLEREGTPDVRTYPPLNKCETLLLARPWTCMVINESSFIKSYSIDEFFMLHVPSVFAGWKVRPNPESPLSQTSTLLRGLTSFSYTAVMPFYNHVSLVLNTMSAMPNLQALSIQLAPCTEKEFWKFNWPGGQPFDFHLSWGEFTTSYSLIGFEVLHKESLVEFHSRDCTIKGVGEDLTSRLDAELRGGKWTSAGVGIWRRHK